MSLALLSDRQHDALSAALRHVRDAELMLARPEPERSLEGAWHLAGFGPECARKAMLDDASLDRAIGHGIAEASELALEFAIAVDPRARRYGADAFVERFPVLGFWDVSHRYIATGVASSGPVEELVATARRVVDTTVLEIWADGRIRGDFSL